MRRLRADLILLFVAVLWGTGFVTQRMVAEQLGFFIFNALRFLLGAVLLAPIALRRQRIPRSELPWLALTGLPYLGGVPYSRRGSATRRPPMPPSLPGCTWSWCPLCYLWPGASASLD